MAKIINALRPIGLWLLHYLRAMYSSNLFSFPTLRVILLLVAVGTCLLWTTSEINTIRSGYQGNSSKVVVHDSLTFESVSVSANSTPITLTSESTSSDKSLAVELIAQSKDFSSWSILLLAGLIGLLTTAKIHRARYLEWVFILFGPGLVFLTTSIYASWILHKRYTYFVGIDDFRDPDVSMMNLLTLQISFFFNAIICIGFLAVVLLFLIVYGTVKPFDNEESQPHPSH